MRRRDFIQGIVGAAAVWPRAAHAQQATLPVIGFLGSGSSQGYAKAAAAFRLGLGEAGYVEGSNVEIESRWANEQYDRLPALAVELVSRRVSLIAAGALASSSQVFAIACNSAAARGHADDSAAAW